MEKMEIEKEAKHLKAARARSTCEDCEEHDHVQDKDVVTKFEAMEKILKNLDGKLTEVGSSICEVFIVMNMLETQVGQNLLGARWVTKKNFRDNSKVPRWRRLLKLIRERWRITLRRP
jgi:hypothetical protein